MSKLLPVLIAFFALSLAVPQAEARRLGGGKNHGLQRSLPAQQQQAAPKAPAQPAQQPQQAAQTAPAQPPATAPKWLAPLTGFALGAALAAFFLEHGLAGVLAALLVLALLVAGLAFLARSVRGRIAPAPLRYAGAGSLQSQLPGGSAGASPRAAASGRSPAGFDAAEFVRHARANFVRLQRAYDRGNTSLLRDFLTPELCREIEADLRAAGPARGQTEVLELRAEVLDLATEGERHVASVRFEGLIREAPGAAAEPFSEIWHLEKPLDGRSGWLLAGIQQT
jgi:predicted lipid-binding transport protein (Tim44 family)